MVYMVTNDSYFSSIRQKSPDKSTKGWIWYKNGLFLLFEKTADFIVLSCHISRIYHVA